MTRLVIAILALVLAGPVAALNPSERLDDPALEERARALSKELRCLVCQNQSIDESDAELAQDLRVLVRERLVEGDTDEEVLAFLTDRYGAFVRLTPPFAASTIALWTLPFVVAALALAASFVYLRRRRPAPASDAALTAEEERALLARLRDRRPD